MNTNILNLTITDRKGHHFFSSMNIIRMEAASSYTVIYSAGRPPFVSTKVLKEFEELLSPYGFVRTHRSHLINCQFVQRIRRTTILMQDASTAEVARRKKAVVTKRIQTQMPSSLIREAVAS